MRVWVTLFVPTVTFKPLKLESSNFIHVYGFLIKIANLYFFSFPSFLAFWGFIWPFEKF